MVSYAIEHPVGIVDAGKIEFLVQDHLGIKHRLDEIGPVRSDDSTAAIAHPTFRFVAEIGKMFAEPLNRHHFACDCDKTSIFMRDMPRLRVDDAVDESVSGPKRCVNLHTLDGQCVARQRHLVFKADQSVYFYICHFD
jgi:hypothetical protein